MARTMLYGLSMQMMTSNKALAMYDRGIQRAIARGNIAWFMSMATVLSCASDHEPNSAIAQKLWDRAMDCQARAETLQVKADREYDTERRNKVYPNH